MMETVYYNCRLLWDHGIPAPITPSTHISYLVFDCILATYITDANETCLISFYANGNHTTCNISYDGTNSSIYNAIHRVITVFINNNTSVVSLEVIGTNGIVCDFVSTGLVWRGLNKSHNVYSKKPEPTIKDVRDHFMLWEHHDKCVINLLPNNKIHFYHIEDPKHRFISTSLFCEAMGMSGEQTLVWVLKYGNTLPKYLE